MNAAAGHVGAIITAVHEAAAAGRQEQRAREAGESARISVETFEARLSALKDRDAYKDHEKLALRRSQLEADKARPAEQQRLARPGPTSTACSRKPTPWPATATSWPRARPAPAGAGRVGGRAGLLRDGEPRTPAPTWP